MLSLFEDSLEWVALGRLFVIVDRVQQAAHDQVQHRDAMANPDAHRIGTGAKTCFRLERRATEGETFTAQRDRMTNHRLKQAKVDRKLCIGLAVETDVIANCSLTIFHSGDKSQHLSVAFQNCKAHIVAETFRKRWEKSDRQRYQS